MGLHNFVLIIPLLLANAFLNAHQLDKITVCVELQVKLFVIIHITAHLQLPKLMESASQIVRIKKRIASAGLIMFIVVVTICVFQLMLLLDNVNLLVVMVEMIAFAIQNIVILPIFVTMYRKCALLPAMIMILEITVPVVGITLFVLRLLTAFHKLQPLDNAFPIVLKD